MDQGIIFVNIYASEYLCFLKVCVWAILRISDKSKPKSGPKLDFSENRACSVPENVTK